MDEENDAPGLLGEYGVVIVPPSVEGEKWFVTVSAWDDDSEAYVTGTDGPILETREEALEEAGKVLDWLSTQSHDDDLLRVWEQMQQDMSPPEIPQPRHGFPWG